MPDLSSPSRSNEVSGSRLPRLPLLSPITPVLQRGPGHLQVGLEPRAVVVRHRAAAALLDHLDGHTELVTVRRLAAESGMTAAEVDTVLHALHGAGLLAVPPETLAAPARAVRLIGLGPLGQQVARLLLDAGLHVYAADERQSPGRRRPFRVTDPDTSPRSRGGRLTYVTHWSKPERVELDLTVVTADAVEPDRLVTDALLRADQPHLVLRSAGRIVTVGPLVQPGQTACLRCTDLTRRDSDPGWPMLLHQLVRMQLATPATLLAWAASLGATQVLAYLQGELPESAGATVELSDHDHLMRWRAWPVHAGCGCSWAATTEWAP